mmetsp:Transcript_13464/g.25641  ORF Transcript_13464/g.25641 Transcript_13464/m.25641 type:complete len:252 (-) Transcript_13464:1151-1906(-)
MITRRQWKTKGCRMPNAVYMHIKSTNDLCIKNNGPRRLGHIFAYSRCLGVETFHDISIVNIKQRRRSTYVYDIVPSLTLGPNGIMYVSCSIAILVVVVAATIVAVLLWIGVARRWPCIGRMCGRQSQRSIIVSVLYRVLSGRWGKNGFDLLSSSRPTGQVLETLQFIGRHGEIMSYGIPSGIVALKNTPQKGTKIFLRGILLVVFVACIRLFPPIRRHDDSILYKHGNTQWKHNVLRMHVETRILHPYMKV